MAFNYLSGYTGSEQIITSTENQELVPNGVKFHKFAFINYQGCRVKINDSNMIFLSAGQGFSADQNDPIIKSFVIVDKDIQFNWIGAFRDALLY